MADVIPICSNSRPVQSGRINEAFLHLQKIVLDGMRHGFFDCSITCEIGNGGKRHLVIRAGKSYKFTFPEEELLG